MFNKFSNPELFMKKYNYMDENTAPPVSTSSTPSVSPKAPTPSPNISNPNLNVTNHGPTPIVPKSNPVKSITPSPSPTKSITGKGKPMGIGEGYSISHKYSHQSNINKIIMENMDMTDIATITQVTHLNEAEQNTFLISLTTKLYSLIVGKIDDIDFGDIPNTKGNVKKLPKYGQIRECIELLHDIFTQYKEDTEPVQVIDNALSNIENNTHLFMSGYAGDIQLVKMVYETTTLGVINALGFMIAVCIEYVKTPKKEGLSIVLNKTGIRKVKDHMMYENLVKFNDSCRNGDLEKALNPLIKEHVKDCMSLASFFGAVRVIVAIGVVAAAILPFLKQMVYFFYASRVRMSTYLDAQADLLEMNASELKNNNNIQTVGDKQRVINRQLKIAKLFHDVANKITIEDKTAENTATADLKKDNKKFKMDQVESNPANVADGPLF